VISRLWAGKRTGTFLQCNHTILFHIRVPLFLFCYFSIWSATLPTLVIFTPAWGKKPETCYKMKWMNSWMSEIDFPVFFLVEMYYSLEIVFDIRDSLCFLDNIMHIRHTYCNIKVPIMVESKISSIECQPIYFHVCIFYLVLYYSYHSSTDILHFLDEHFIFLSVRGLGICCQGMCKRHKITKICLLGELFRVQDLLQNSWPKMCIYNMQFSRRYTWVGRARKVFYS
jgi:hypothetical protein